MNALNCFKRAQELDPTWDAPLNLERTLTKFLMDVKHLIEMKGKLKTKRYNTMVNSIDSKNIGKNSKQNFSNLHCFFLKLQDIYV